MINEMDKAYNEALNLFSENNTITKDTVVNGKPIQEIKFHGHDPFHVYEQLRILGFVAKTGDNVYEITPLGRDINIQGGWIAYRKAIEEDKGLSKEVKRSIKISNYIHAISIVAVLGVLLYVTFTKNDPSVIKELMEVNKQVYLKDIEHHKEMLLSKFFDPSTDLWKGKLFETIIHVSFRGNSVFKPTILDELFES